jgi:hypothetical protein
MEEEPTNHLVGSLATESGLRLNMTTQEFENLQYSFLDRTEMQNLFVINDRNGDLRTKIEIDREKICRLFFHKLKINSITGIAITN